MCVYRSLRPAGLGCYGFDLCAFISVPDKNCLCSVEQAAQGRFGSRLMLILRWQCRSCSFHGLPNLSPRLCKFDSAFHVRQPKSSIITGHPARAECLPMEESFLSFSSFLRGSKKVRLWRGPKHGTEHLNESAHAVITQRYGRVSNRLSFGEHFKRCKQSGLLSPSDQTSY